MVGSLAFLFALTTPFAPAACRPVKASAAQTLVQRAITALGLHTVGARVRTANVSEVINMAYQSDRMYPPYLWQSRELKTSMDWEHGVHRMDIGKAPGSVSFVTDSARKVAILPRGAMLMPSRQAGLLDERAMDPWAVLADWRSAPDVTVAEECMYRDYWRTVLSRKTAEGVERLFVDPNSGMPVKLERREPHYLWGDVLAEFLWSIWTPVKGSRALAPQFAFRMVDGETDEQRSLDQYALVERDSAGVLTFPATATPQPAAPSSNPDTVRVAANTFLLTTRAYTNVVSLQRDTVFVLDAQTSLERAHFDSLWIGRLFPGAHPIVLVVTDLAWPHIAGVRFWVALGATVVSHPASQTFLERVVRHKWLLQPDRLELRNSQTKLTFRPVMTTLALAGGAIQVRRIDGAGSEGALMVYLPNEHFLYAGDYIQGGGPDSFSATYAREVAAAVQRAGFAPERFAAMHVSLTSWTSLSRFTGQP